MNPVLKLFFFLLILALPLQDLQARVIRTQRKEYYANGKIKSVTVTKVKTPRNIDLFNFYKQTTVKRTEFDSISGMKTMNLKRITKVGIGGKHCYEYMFAKTTFDPNGKKLKYEFSKCDRHKYMYKNYVDGKVEFIHIEKKRRRK